MAGLPGRSERQKTMPVFGAAGRMTTFAAGDEVIAGIGVALVAVLIQRVRNEVP